MAKSQFRITFTQSILLAVLALNLASCGRDGKLYLEQEPATAQTQKDQPDPERYQPQTSEEDTNKQNKK